MDSDFDVVDNYPETPSDPQLFPYFGQRSWSYVINIIVICLTNGCSISRRSKEVQNHAPYMGLRDHLEHRKVDHLEHRIT